MLEITLLLTLIANALWFAGGFHVFHVRGEIFAKIVVPKENRDTPVFEVLVKSGKFLGGFNFALAMLCVLLLLSMSLFTDPLQWALLLFVIAVAHGTQFAGNVPVALQNRKGEGVWQVTGLMRFIFVTDFLMTVLNLFVASLFLLNG